MISKKEFLRNFKLYAVTDIAEDDQSAELLEKIDAVYRGGADIVQLRAKKLNDRRILALGAEIRKIADDHGKLFFVNDRADLALACRADGVHVGQEDLPVAEVRRIAPGLLVGKSTHSLEQALAAEAEGPDYLGVGPVFATPTKPDYPPAGLEFVRQAALKIKLPFTAIGGIHSENIDQVLNSGATRIAVVRAVFSGKDAYESARNLRAKIENFCHTGA